MRYGGELNVPGAPGNLFTRSNLMVPPTPCQACYGAPPSPFVVGVGNVAGVASQNIPGGFTGKSVF